MTSPRSLLLTRLTVWAATAGYWTFSFVMTHKPPGDLPRVPVDDKLAHLVSYSVITILLSASLWLADVRRGRALFIAIAAGLFYGVVDELLQIPVGRTAEVGDWVADAAGTVLGAGTMWATATLVAGRRRAMNRSHVTPADATIRA